VLDKKSIIIGYSGHALVVAETAIDNEINLIGYAEKNPVSNNPFQLDYLGFENEENFIGWKKEASFVLGIGDNNIRQKVAHLIESKGKSIETVIHNSASISKAVTIGFGTFVNRNVAINAFAKIGKHVILNTACIIEHECIIADAVHIAPGAVLAGNVTVGERTFIGANVVIKQGITIGKDVIIGAGSVIINDIPDGKKVVGNPSRII
jgi:sugar O-acyltransferase (sialic acid O-acetyltransferase NeuD family)